MNYNDLKHTDAELKIMKTLKKIQETNHLKSVNDAYQFVMEHWYLHDVFWLRIVSHMKANGRLQ